ncbi:uncharacterized protein B0T23DRAFT_101903 [Neurospora hispaniola]|uniref:histidine kinase n=1 Tax=Neurospora hispaniola TaxID=588809 RepID=A0AAJ0MSA6_9PEZI|nr:hypothetical protein B0T23DRAFT_101903 [Neurospora hispaniola]
MRNVSERAREWQTFRFLSTVRDSRAVPDPAHTSPNKSRRASSDTVLTALAQLGVLQLSARRGVLSLFDHDVQHIAAEATPTLPLRPYARDEITPLLLRGRDISRSEVICDNVVREQRRHPEDLIVFVIPDLLADPRFHHIPSLLEQEIYPRFYAGVPICSPSGVVIGLFSVFDTTPRQKLDEFDIDFMKDLSRTISRQLESYRKQAVLLQTERILRGVVSYSEGRDDISDLSEYHAERDNVDPCRRDTRDTYLFDRHCASYFPHSNGSIDPPTHIGVSEDAIDGTLSSSEYEAEHLRKLSLPDHRSLDSRLKAGDTHSSDKPMPPDTPTQGTLGADVRLSEIQKSFAKASNIIRQSMDAAGVIFLDANTSPFHCWQDGDANTTSDVHTGAASISSNKVNGVANSEIDMEVRPHKRPCDILGFSVTPTGTPDGTTIDPTGPLRHPGPHRSWRVLSESFLRKLLRRYPRGTIWEFDAAGNFISASEAVPMPSPPSSTSPSCPYSDSEIDTAAKRQRRGRARRKNGTLMRKPRKSECDTIHAAFPEARAVSFFPLWGTQMQRWFAAGLSWTRESLHTLAPQDELGLFNAFGKNVMAEVARIDATLANQAKSDMLGSISHEMLSPLHGILGAAELLLDTDLSTSQMELICLVEASVRTLLDTVDHLLDHSKINSLVENTKLSNARRGIFQSDDLEHSEGPDLSGPPETSRMRLRSGSLAPKPWPWEQPTLTRFYDVDLAVMLEEVVESLYAGYSFQRWCNQRGADPGDDNVAIHLDIDPTVNWSYYAQPGALRRILMNLFGNALKFTHKGFINLSLTAQPIPSEPRPSFASTDLDDEAEDPGIETDSKHSSSYPKSKTGWNDQNHSNVVLTVSDTGKGITRRFLREKAFSPFQKEDSLTPGPGLGLSIVKQIVCALNGRVVIDSRPGEGTTVRVIIPLQHSSPEATSEDRDIVEHREALGGLRICLLGFDGLGDGDPDGNQWGEPVGAKERKVLRGRIMERMCRDWLGSQVVTNPAEAQMTICSDRFVLDMCTKDGADDKTGGRGFASKTLAGPLVVVCGNEVVAQNLSLARGESAAGGKGEASVMEFIGQPVGPRKLAKTLRKCLQQHPVPLKERGGERTSSESSIDLDVLQRKMSDPEVFQIANKKSRFLPYLADDFGDNLFSTNQGTAAAATRPLVQRTSMGKDGKEEGGKMGYAPVSDMEEGEKVEEAAIPEPTLLQNMKQEETSLPLSAQQKNIKMPLTRPPLPPRYHTGKEKTNSMDFGFTTVSISEVSSPFDSIISPPVLTNVPASPEDEQVSPMSHATNTIPPSGTIDASTSIIGNAGPTGGAIVGAAAAPATSNTMTGTAAVPDVSLPPKPPELLEPYEAQRQQSILITSPVLTGGQPPELHLDTRRLSKASNFSINTTSSPSQPSPPSQSLSNSPSQPRKISSNFSPNQEEKACLLVDDNPINLHILASAMRKTHRPYATARNGLEAVEIYKENPGRYKWVLMDISMPVMDGLEATRKIREFEREYPVQRSRSLGRSLSTKRGSVATEVTNAARARAGSLDFVDMRDVEVQADVEAGAVSGAGNGKRVIQKKAGRASLNGIELASAPLMDQDRGAPTDGDAQVVQDLKAENVQQVNGEEKGDEGVTGLEANSTEGELINGLEPATVVALTGVTSGTIQKDALASGVDLFLTKPVRMKDLGAILGDG